MHVIYTETENLTLQNMFKIFLLWALMELMSFRNMQAAGH